MSASEVAGGAEVPGGAIEDARGARKGRRWRIACINWSHATAPKAVVYLATETAFYDRYFKTWAEAIAWADKELRGRK